MHDCIVLGIGGFGSGVVDCIARRGVSVLGLEQFGPAHNRGSSHGETRIIRKAYFEHPDYVPLCIKAYDLWRSLEADTNTSLMTLCGLMLAGPEEGEAIAGARLAAKQHDLPLENMTADEAMRRFPGFRISEEYAVAYESDAGFLRVENCVQAHIDRANQNGATLRFNEAVQSWTSDGRTVRITTDKAEYESAQLVITAGAWSSQILADLDVSLEVVRKPQFWHEVATSNYNLDAGCPGYLFEQPDGVFYGFPSLDGKVLKVAEHSGGQVVADPSHLNREVNKSDTGPVEDFLTNCLPEVKSPAVRSAICMYTLSADRHFIVDKHPRYENVVIGAGFSGHGFKFTTVLSEAMADLTLDGATGLPVGFLRLRRSTL